MHRGTFGWAFIVWERSLRFDMSLQQFQGCDDVDTSIDGTELKNVTMIKDGLCVHISEQQQPTSAPSTPTSQTIWWLYGSIFSNRTFSSKFCYLDMVVGGKGCCWKVRFLITWAYSTSESRIELEISGIQLFVRPSCRMNWMRLAISLRRKKMWTRN